MKKQQGKTIPHPFLTGFIALREHITIPKVIKLIPPLSHPVFQYKPPMLNLVKVWRVAR
jgi:hypothetical protein